MKLVTKLALFDYYYLYVYEHNKAKNFTLFNLNLLKLLVLNEKF